MSHFLTASAISMFLLLAIGSLIAPEASFMWLANTEMYFVVLRMIVVAMLAALLLTSPPRSHHFRIVAGILAVVMVGTVWSQLSVNALLLLDAFTFAQAAVILAIAAIEPSEEPVTSHTHLFESR